MTREELMQKMAVLLGGRAAENIIFGHLSTGASDDLAKTTHIARDMVTRYGMSEDLGFVTYEENSQSFLGIKELTSHSYSDSTAKLIDEKVKQLVMEAYRQSLEILETNRALLEEASQELLKQETLTEEQLKTFFVRLKNPESFRLPAESAEPHPIAQQ
jgi:cell division protease FtsH